MILVDTKGLLWGRRLRKLSLKARLYYPLILGITNFYARLELDETQLLSHFSSYADADITAENLMLWLREYEQAGLALFYTANGQTWVQFDTPVAMRREYPTKEDNASPAPPAAEYAEWIKSLHGDKWQNYDLSRYQDTLSEKRADAGRRGGNVSGEVRKQTPSKLKQNEANGSNGQANEAVAVVGVVVGDGVGVGDGVVEGEVEGEVTSQQASSKQAIPSFSQSNDEEPDEEAELPTLYAGMLDGLLNGTFPNGRIPEEAMIAAKTLSDATGDDTAYKAAMEKLYAKYPMHDWNRVEQWADDISPLLADRKARGDKLDLYALMMWAYGNPRDSFWTEKTVNMKAFVTHYLKGNLVEQFNAALLKPETWVTQYYVSGGDDPCPFPMGLHFFVPMPKDWKSMLAAHPFSQATAKAALVDCPMCLKASEQCRCQYTCADCKRQYTGLNLMHSHMHR